MPRVRPSAWQRSNRSWRPPVPPLGLLGSVVAAAVGLLVAGIAVTVATSTLAGSGIPTPGAVGDRAARHRWGRAGHPSGPTVATAWLSHAQSIPPDGRGGSGIAVTLVTASSLLPQQIGTRWSPGMAAGRSVISVHRRAALLPVSMSGTTEPR